MKIRTGFVSNSSSSSFIIIDASEGYCDFEGPLSFGNIGTTEFGWGPEIVKDVHSRINFAYLQARYSKDRLKMLEKVIHDHSGLKEKITWNITDECWPKDKKVWGYIDHQSAASEGVNLEMFEDEKALKDFLFGEGSKIVLDNDNH